MRDRGLLQTMAVSYATTRPIVTARGVVSARSGVSIRCSNVDGRVGLGEVLPLPGWSSLDVEAVVACLDQLERTALAIGSEVVTALPAEVRAGIDAALWNLRAVESAQPLWAALGAPTGDVAINALVAVESEAQLRSDLAAAVDAGYRTIKCKVDAPDDRDRLAVIAHATPQGVRVRLDANQGWDQEDAVAGSALAVEMLGDRLEYIEDPVATMDDLASVRSRLSCRVAVDELVKTGSDLHAVIASGLADAVVLKPALVGGIDSVRDLAQQAAQGGLDVVLSSLYDGPAGLASWLHLAAALPGNVAHGLGTADLIDHPDMARLVPVSGTVLMS